MRKNILYKNKIKNSLKLFKTRILLEFDFYLIGTKPGIVVRKVNESKLRFFIVYFCIELEIYGDTA